MDEPGLGVVDQGARRHSPARSQSVKPLRGIIGSLRDRVVEPGPPGVAHLRSQLALRVGERGRVLSEQGREVPRDVRKPLKQAADEGPGFDAGSDESGRG